MSEQDDIDKTLNYVQGQLQQALQPLIGRKNDEHTQAAVKASINRVFERMGHPDVQSEIASVGADFIRAQLARPSPLKNLLPALRGPYVPWNDGDGVVHWALYVNEQLSRCCDFMPVLTGAECLNEPISCLWCLSAPKH